MERPNFLKPAHTMPKCKSPCNSRVANGGGGGGVQSTSSTKAAKTKAYKSKLSYRPQWESTYPDLLKIAIEGPEL